MKNQLFKILNENLILKNNRGQSLIQVIVSASVMMIVIYAMMTAQIMQFKENKALAEQMAALDFSRIVTQALSNSSTCNSLVASTNVLSGSVAGFS